MNAKAKTRERTEIRHELNIRLLLISLLVAAIVVPAIYFWHSTMSANLAETFMSKAEAKIQEADEFEQVGDTENANECLSDATDLIWQFRRLNPDDGPSAVLMAETFDRAPQSESFDGKLRAVELFLDATQLTSEPEQSQLRLRASEILLETGNPWKAEEISRTILEQPDLKDHHDADFIAKSSETFALASWGSRSPEDLSSGELGTALQRAIEQNPSNTELPILLAMQYRDPVYSKQLSQSQKAELQERMADRSGSNEEQLRFEKADQIVDQMVQRNGKLEKAYFNRYLYRIQFDQNDLANRDLTKSLELAPYDPDINLEMGNRCMREFNEFTVSTDVFSEDYSDQQKKLLTKAQLHFENCVDRDPENVVAHLNLGIAQALMGDVESAVATLSQVLSEADENELAPNVIAPLAECRMRLVQGLIELEKLDEASEELGKINLVIDRYSSREFDPEILSKLVQSRQYITALLMFRQGLHGEAISVLNQSIQDETRQPGRSPFNSIRLLGEIHLDLDQPSLAANTYEVATKIDSSNREFAMRLGGARGRAGQLQAAVDAIRPFAVQSQAPEDWLQVADLLYRIEIRKQVSAQDWSAFKDAMNKVRDKQAQSPNAEEIEWRSELLSVKAQKAQAISTSDASNGNIVATPDVAALRNLEDQSEDNPELLRELVTTNYSLGNVDKAESYFDRYVELVGNRVERFVFEAGLHLQNENIDAASETLERGLAVVDDEEKLDLLLAQINLLLIQGEAETATGQLQALADQYPDSKQLIIKLADLSVQIPGQTTMVKAAWEDRLPEIEGVNGPYATFLAAQRKLLEAAETKNLETRGKLLLEAGRLARKVVGARSDWYAAYSLAGTVYRLQSENTERSSRQYRQAIDQMDRAKRSFRRAVELGERRNSVLEQIIRIDPETASQFIANLDPEQVLGDSRVSDIHVALLRFNNDPENALKFAVDATEARSIDPLAWITRARVETSAGDFEAAESSLEQVKLHAGNGETRQPILLEMFRVYASVEQHSPSPETSRKWKRAARDLMPEIIELSEPRLKRLLHGEMLAALGDVDEAAKWFSNAEKNDPNDVGVLESALSFYSANRFASTTAIDEAIRIAKKLAYIDPNSSRYRSILANLLVGRGTVDDWREVATVLRTKGPVSANSPEDRFTHAAILIQQTNIPNSQRLKNLEEAVTLVKDGERAQDRILAGMALQAWAELLMEKDQSDLRQQKLELAEKQFSEATQKPDITNGHLIMVADFFIKRKNWDAANMYVRRLSDRTGNSVINYAPVIALEARLLHGRSVDDGTVETNADVKMVEEFGKRVELETRSRNQQSRAVLFQRVADIFDSIDEKQLSKMWRLKASELDSKQLLFTARQLNRNGYKDEAIAQFIKGFKETGSIDFVLALSDALITEGTKPEHFQSADQVFADAMRDFPGNVRLMTCIGNVRIAGQDQVEDAIDLYLKALELDENNPLLLNNLATAYSEIPEQLPVALKYIEKALARYPNHAGLIDTKAIIVMLQGDLNLAEAMLTDIVNQNSDPRYWWHLSEVRWKRYAKSNNAALLRSAHQAFDKSIEMGLEKQALTPSEKRRLSTLRKNLDSKKVSSHRSSKKQFLISDLTPTRQTTSMMSDITAWEGPQ